MAIINDDNITLVMEVVRGQAEKACRARGMIDPDDIAQDVLVRVLEEDRAGRLDSVDPTSPQFFSILKRYTSKAVNDEATDYMYFTGGYVYDRPTVVHVLENLLWAEPGTIDDAEKRVDVKASYDRMSESYRLAIYKRYALGIAPAEDGGEKMTLSRATDALMHDLNFRSRRTAVPLDEVEEGDIERQRHQEPA